jgi:hypothetical protein
MTKAANIPEAAITEPTERSKPPEIITIVAPIDPIPIMTIARPILEKLVELKKYGDRLAKIISSRISATRRPKPVGPKNFLIDRKIFGDFSNLFSAAILIFTRFPHRSKPFA